MSVRRFLTISAGVVILLGVAAPIAEAAPVPRATTTSIVVQNLNDSGSGSLRAALTAAAATPDDTTVITFAVAGTITLSSALPAISTRVVLDGTATTGYVAGGAPVVGLDFAGFSGLSIAKGAGGSQVLGMALGNATGDGILVAAPAVTIASNYVGLTTAGKAAPNTGNGVHLIAGSDGSIIGSNPQNSSAWASNIISANAMSGLLIEDSSKNTVVANRIGTAPDGKTAAANGRNGIEVSGSSVSNMLGGTVSVDGVTGVANNPTGDKGKVTPTFTRPPLGNVVSGNTGAGIAVSGATDTVISGNFVGTTASGSTDLGNGGQGILVDKADRTRMLGCAFVDEPFIYYNVVSGNGTYGIEVRDSDAVDVQGNFIGMAADNKTTLGNDADGLWVNGTSKNTIAGGPIPLGNVTSGNGHNGIAVTGAVSGFLSFNNFAGLAAFGGAAPNQWNGIYVNATGGNNSIRTSVTSGNVRDGIRLAGNTTGVTVEPVISGLTTSGSTPLPNGGNGLTITGQAHNNVIGGTLLSVMPHGVFSGNKGFGIRIEGKAHNNVIYNTYVGVTIVGDAAVGNAAGGISVAGSAHNNIIGGKKSAARRSNIIAGNIGNGVALGARTHHNSVVNNYIGVGRLGMTFPNTGKNIVDNGKGNIVRSNVLSTP